MTAFRCHPRCFHAARAATDDEHFPLLLGRTRLVLGQDLPAQGGVDPAFELLVLVSAIEAVEAAVAHSDIFDSTFLHLVGKLRIGQQTAGHPHEIEAALSQILLAQVLIEAACRPHRDRHAFRLDGFHKRHRRPAAVPTPVESLRQVLQVPIGVEDAVGLEQTAAVPVALAPAVDTVGHLGDELGHLGALVDGGRQGVVVLNDVEECVYGEVGTAAPFGLAMMSRRKRVRFSKALRAVLVLTLVPHPRQEGVALVEGAVVDLTGVEPCLPRALGRGSPQIDLILHFLPGHLPAGQEVRSGKLLLGHGGGALDVADLGITRQQAGGVPRARVLELDGDGAVVLVRPPPPDARSWG